MKVDPWHKRLLGSIIAWTIRLVTATVRVRIAGRAAIDALLQRGERIIYCFWHGRQAILLKAHEGEDVVIMVSLSQDGTLQKRVVEHYGYDTVRGSSSRRGVVALLQMKRMIAEDAYIGALAVDGPGGPREQVKAGAATLASKAGAHLVPLTAAYARRWTLGSWDRLQIPWPFSRAWMVYGEPIAVQDTPDSREEGTQGLQAALERITLRAEELAGR